ncbi:hypothetical protein CDD80_4709 [Ophiocordyceps camponoti-rufipedis]|uniref:Uncharacterized protein n=1 Tax=Ophiocordyceps camponoti-rufipedis TaxID=2004952 RepID=A0A2C5ZIB4_9HYPO|nr:hypothetical protein CDD80_4709 [Ophiocordyceps camponoti-rufipedis]
MVKPAILSTGLLAAPIHSLHITALNLTAIAASNGKSTLECWQVGPLKTSSAAGSIGSPFYSLGDVADVTFVLFVSGMAHITLPDGSDEVTIQGGKKGLILATDTADVSMQGHLTQFPSNENTVALQMPIKDPEKFRHTVLHSGGCHEVEMSGL